MLKSLPGRASQALPGRECIPNQPGSCNLTKALPGRVVQSSQESVLAWEGPPNQPGIYNTTKALFGRVFQSNQERGLASTGKGALPGRAFQNNQESTTPTSLCLGGSPKSTRKGALPGRGFQINQESTTPPKGLPNQPGKEFCLTRKGASPGRAFQINQESTTPTSSTLRNTRNTHSLLCVMMNATQLFASC